MDSIEVTLPVGKHHINNQLRTPLLTIERRQRDEFSPRETIHGILKSGCQRFSWKFGTMSKNFPKASPMIIPAAAAREATFTAYQ